MTRKRASASSPNERLQRERMLRGWTQADVAGFIGTDGYTVNRWERGRTHPRPYFCQKLCELFDKNAADLGLLPASSTTHDLDSPSPDSYPSPVLWSVPHRHNPYFVGREALLHTLHAQLTSLPSGVHTQVSALCGLGGIGKTQVALEYAYRYAQHYQALFWIEAETVESVLSSMQRLAEVLQLPDPQLADQHRLVTAIHQWLVSHHQWLLIWDHLEELDLLQRFLPPTQHGSILITTRSQALGSLAQELLLPPMTLEEGSLFVLRRAKVLPLTATEEQRKQLVQQVPAEFAAVRELVTTMGGLPLALDQAGAYIEETRCSFSSYLKRYEHQRTPLLSYRGITTGGHPHTVTTTFLLAHQQVEQMQGAAADILRACAFLHAEALPEELFASGATHLGPQLEPMATTPLLFDQAMAILHRFSLVQRHPETHTFSLHRLVQVVLQEEMVEQERAVWLGRIVAAFNALWPEAISSSWKQGKRLLPHILVVIRFFSDDTVDQELAELLQKAADYLRERDQYKRAEMLYRRALRIWKQALGPDTPKAIHALNGLAQLYYERGKYEQAEAFYQRVLYLQEQTLRPEDDQIALSLNNLVILCQMQGKYGEARALYQRALNIYDHTPGSVRPKIAQCLSNLADLSLEQRTTSR